MNLDDARIELLSGDAGFDLPESAVFRPVDQLRMRNAGPDRRQRNPMTGNIVPD